jgi:hypothetical protein
LRVQAIETVDEPPFYPALFEGYKAPVRTEKMIEANQEKSND